MDRMMWHQQCEVPMEAMLVTTNTPFGLTPPVTTRQSSVSGSAPNFVVTSACLFNLIIGQTKLFL
jgi:hypothetical protein